MKRSPLLRKTPLRTGKPLKAVGPALAKRKARTRKARASAHTKAWRLAVLTRDGYRCTAIVKPQMARFSDGVRVIGIGIECSTRAFALAETDLDCRCWHVGSLGTLHVHHLDYKHLGAERLEDGVTLCQPHHEYLESQIRWYRRHLA